jgi:hypothetical protein
MKTYWGFVIGFLQPGRPVCPTPVQVTHTIPFTDESGMPQSDESCTFAYRSNYTEPAGCLTWFLTTPNLAAYPSSPNGNLNGSYPVFTNQTSTSLKIVTHHYGHGWIGSTSSDYMLSLAATILSSDAVFLTPKEHYNKGRNKKDLLDPENHWARRALHTTLVTQACMARQLTKATSIPRAHMDLKRSEMI